MMNYKDQLEGGFRFLRIRRIKRVTLGVLALVLVAVSILLFVLAGPRLDVLYLPVSAFLLFALVFLLLLSGMNFGFRYIEVRSAKMDSQRHLVIQNSRKNAWWAIAVSAFALVVLLVLTQSGYFRASMTIEDTISIVNPGDTYTIQDLAGAGGIRTRDILGITRTSGVEITVVTLVGSATVSIIDLDTGQTTEVELVLGGSTEVVPLGLPTDNLRRFSVQIRNEGPAAVQVTYRFPAEPIPDIALYLPVVLVALIGANLGWVFFLEPLRKKYQASSIYSPDYTEKIAPGEETYDQYQARVAGPKPATGAEVRPGVFTTDRPCPSCGKPLVFVQKFRRHYCLSEMKYPTVAGEAAPTATVRPAPLTPAPPAPSAEMKNPCPTCGRDLRWVERYSRFYCAMEQKYAPRDYTPPEVPKPTEVPQPPAPAPTAAPPSTQPPIAVSDIRPVPVEAKPVEPTADGMVREASEAYHAGDYPKAITLLEAVLEKEPNHVAALLSHGAALMKTGRRLDALGAFEKVLSIEEANERALQIRALILEGEGRWKDAVEAFNAYLAVKPGDAEILGKKADAFLALGRRDEALATYEKALAMNPRDARIRTRIDELKFDVAAALSRALLASAGGNYSQAVSLFDQVLLREPTNVNALMGKAVALRRSGDLESAMGCVRQVLTTTPNHPAALLNLGRILEEQGKDREALGAYQELLQANPQDAEGWERQGELLRKEGRTVEALFSFRQALKARGSDASLEEQVKALERLVKVEPAAPPREVERAREPLVVPAEPVKEEASEPTPEEIVPEPTPPEEPPVSVPAVETPEPPSAVILPAEPEPEEAPEPVVEKPEEPPAEVPDEEPPAEVPPEEPPAEVPPEPALEEIPDTTGEKPVPAGAAGEPPREDLGTELTKIKGVGPARVKNLLKAGYDTLEKVRAASEEDLAAVKGLSKTVAKAIRKHFAG